jgi:hypothetical protein
VTGCCEHGDEPSDSIKGGEFLDSLSEYQLLNKKTAPYILGGSNRREC